MERQCQSEVDVGALQRAESFVSVEQLAVKIGLMLHSQSLPDQKKPRILRDLCLLSRTLGLETDEVTFGLAELLTVSGAIEMKVVPVCTS
jgi:hypothetical protein